MSCMFSGPQTFSQAVSGLRASKKQEALTLPLPYKLAPVLEVLPPCLSPGASGDLPVTLAGLVDAAPRFLGFQQQSSLESQTPLLCGGGAVLV